MMPAVPPAYDIRAACCTISNRARFLTELRRIGEAHATRIICFNADLLAGMRHAARAAMLAQRAFEAGENISNTLEMEALLYAAGSRQCTVAAAFGIREGENRLYICCLPKREAIWAALESLVRFYGDDGDTIGPEKRDLLMTTFSISPGEVAAAGGDDRIADLVLERVALLQVLR